MSRKSIVMLGMVIGSIVGGYLPLLFGVELFSFTSIIGNAVGGLLGVWMAFKITS